MQPIGDMLARNTQRRAIFHQTHIVNIGHLGTANTLINPAHHIAQNTLRIIVQFPLDLLSSQIPIQQRRRQNRLQTRAFAPREFCLPRRNIHLMIVHRVQCGRSWRRNPRSSRPRFRVIHLRLHHLPHRIRHRPHPLANLPFADQPRLNTHIHIPIFISRQPRLRLNFILGKHSTGFHTRVHLITRAIQKSRIDKNDALAGFPHSAFQIDSRAPFLIHNPDLQRISRKSKRILHAPE